MGLQLEKGYNNGCFSRHFRKLGAVKMSDVCARQDPKQIFFIYLIFPLNLHIIVLN